MQVSKTIITALLLAISAGFVLFGGRATTGVPKDRVLVQYWEKWTGNEAAQMQQIVDWFNKTAGAEKGIYVQYLSMSNINQKTLVSTAAGVPPDVAGLWDGQVAQFASNDALEPLDDLAREYGITPDYYKPVFWDACTYQGRLCALISTPAAVALHYNKAAFAAKAQQLREAGLKDDRPPRTLDELDRYAKILDEFDGPSGKVSASGYIPLEPGWYTSYTSYWFGYDLFDHGRIKLNHPALIQSLEWIRQYSLRLGIDQLSEFRSGFGQFNSSQNPFLTGSVMMVQQGPWMANYIENLKPEWNRWNMPEERRRLDEQLAQEVRDGKLAPEERMIKWASLVPAAERRRYCQWGVEAFPSAVAGLTDVTYCGFDTLVIPKGSRHKKEAFEFIAFVNRQDVMEKLCLLHCKNSPLARVSGKFIAEHPNPYIEVFERLSASANAHGLPSLGVWPQVQDELQFAIQQVYLLKATPQEVLDAAQERADGFVARFERLQSERKTGRAAQ